MKWLFIYAHPDDESVAAGGTIRKLIDAGDEVVVVLATNGNRGSIKDDGVLPIEREIFNSLEEKEKKEVVGVIRKKELKNACKVLGVSEFEVLDFEDGKINNEVVWGSMILAFVDSIDKHKPDAIVTFDHTGWNFHMDHVGVSLATIKAMQQSKHRVEILLFNIFHPPGIKDRWKYHYPNSFPITHKVNISDVREVKAEALKAHVSQKLHLIDKLLNGEMDEEDFQVVKSTKKGRELLGQRDFFVKV